MFVDPAQNSDRILWPVLKAELREGALGNMARLARVEVFAADEVAVVHVMTRMVRRCVLPWDDALTGKNYDHRKQWKRLSDAERQRG